MALGVYHRQDEIPQMRISCAEHLSNSHLIVIVVVLHAR